MKNTYIVYQTITGRVLLTILFFLSTTLVSAPRVSANAPKALTNQTADSLIQEGDTATKQGNIEFAVQKYSEALQNAPNNISALEKRAASYERLEDYELALADYEMIVSLAPYYRQIYVDMCILQYAYLDDKDGAWTNCQSAIEIDVNLDSYSTIDPLPAAYNILGAIEQDKNQNIDSALQHYEMALELAPQYMAAQKNLGVLYFELEAYEKAEDALLAVLDIDSSLDLYSQSSSDAYLLPTFTHLGFIYHNQNDYAQAIAAYTEAIELESVQEYDSYSHALYNRARIYSFQSQYAMALADISKLVELSPNSYGVYVERGKLYQNNKEYELAFNDFNNALALNPADPEQIYFNRAMAYKQLEESRVQTQSELKQRITELTLQLDRDAQDVGSLFERASIYEQLGKNVDALADYEAIQEVAPTFRTVLNKLGWFYFLDGNSDTAEKVLQTVLSINPQNDEYSNINPLPVAYNLLALVAKYYDEDEEQALRYFEQAVELAPEYTVVHQNLGLHYFVQRDYENAEKYLKNVFAVNPNNDLYSFAEHSGYMAASYRTLGQVVCLRDLVCNNPESLTDETTGPAFTAFSRAVELNPNDSLAQIGLGELYLAVDDYDNALKFARSATEINPESAQAFTLLGDVHCEMNKACQISGSELVMVLNEKTQPAFDAYTTAISLENPSSRAYAQLGTLNFKMRKDSTAEKLFQQAIEKDPNNAVVYFRMGLLKYEQDHEDQAEIYFSKAIELKPDFFDAYIELGKVLTAMEKFGESVIILEQAAILKPKSEKPYIQKAITLLYQHKYSDALPVLSVARQKNPSNADVYVFTGIAYEGVNNAKKAIENYERYLTFDTVPASSRDTTRQSIARLSGPSAGEILTGALLLGGLLLFGSEGSGSGSSGSGPIDYTQDNRDCNSNYGCDGQLSSEEAAAGGQYDRP